ncbi:MAG: deoxyribose-phosphate aldolase [Firmicutes bacterium]|nr:deoxyribose-phosphate aldolase [Bacillota bacterium]
MELNEFIDQTNLKAFATESDILNLCQEAIYFKFKAVCINPCYIKLAKKKLENTKILVCTVIGFPLGANAMEVKVFEAFQAYLDGADEFDLVINIGALKSKNYDYVQKEIELVQKVIENKTLKVIIETCYLTEEEIIIMTEICNKLNVDFIKTSTGFGSRGVNIRDLELIKMAKSHHLEIKASGGIKDYETALEFIEAGASRIGTSSGSKIMLKIRHRN